MSVVILGPSEIEALVALRARAEASPTPLAVLTSLGEGEPAPGGMNPTFTVKIPTNLTVTFTHEVQPIGLCRHVSMSVNLNGRVPHPTAVAMVLPFLGFTQSAKTLGSLGLVWMEAFGAHTQNAVNVLEPVNFPAFEKRMKRGPDVHA